MTVRELMTPSAVCVGPHATGADAMTLLRQLALSALPVCLHDRLVGIVTENVLHDEGRDLSATRVGDVMIGGVVFVFDDASPAEAAEIFGRHPVRHLPVLNRDHRIVGCVALDDLKAPLVSSPNESPVAPVATRRIEP